MTCTEQQGENRANLHTAGLYAQYNCALQNKDKNYKQGSYRFSVAKFPDFSSHGMTISLTLSKQ